MAIDIAGPWPTSSSGNKYIMVVCDYFTKWVEAYSIPDQDTVAERFVNDSVCRYGVPRQLHTDQGSNFQSNLFKEMCDLLGIDKTRTTPFHPASDGMVERFNRTMENLLSTYVADDQHDWDLKLPCALMAYRATPHESTQCSPNLMMLGREVELPIDLMFGRPPFPKGELEVFDTTLYYVDMLRDKLERAHEYARKCLKKRAERQKRNYDNKVQAECFYVGEQVWLYTPKRQVGLSPKLQSFWDGPYVILLTIGENIYKIQKSPTSRIIVVHRDRLYKYCGDETSWFNPNTTPTSDIHAQIPPQLNDDDGTESDIANDINDVDSENETNPLITDNNTVTKSHLPKTKSGRINQAPQRYGDWV